MLPRDNGVHYTSITSCIPLGNALTTVDIAVYLLSEGRVFRDELGISGTSYRRYGGLNMV